VKLDFTLDITAPQIPGSMLDTKFDSAPIGDSYTTFDKVNLIGQTEANATVILQQTGISITADPTGKFTFTDVPLILGDNSFTVNAQDIAGNTSTFTTIIKRVAQDNSDVVLDWNGILIQQFAIKPATKRAI
jgi:outer membrane usher protein FimD/PapC